LSAAGACHDQIVLGLASFYSSKFEVYTFFNTTGKGYRIWTGKAIEKFPARHPVLQAQKRSLLLPNYRRTRLMIRLLG
jgi:hypothetical protein